MPESYDGIVCPHCGHRHDDADNLADANMHGDMSCEECEALFYFEAETVISWVSGKIKGRPNG